MNPDPPPIRRLAFLVIAGALLLFFWMVRGVALPVIDVRHSREQALAAYERLRRT